MAQLKRYNGTSWENVGGSVAPKTSQTTSDTDTYSCNYVNDNLTNIKSAIDYKSPDYMGDVVVESIRSKNLLRDSLVETSSSGLTLKNKEDGSTTITGTQSSSTIYFTNIKHIPVSDIETGNYTISFHNASYGNISYRLRKWNGSTKTNIQNETLLQTENYSLTLNLKNLIDNDTIQVELDIVCFGTNAKNVTLYPMIEKGSTATVYSPYQNLTGEENYSTGEQVIGTYIDGKPVYKKTISVSKSSSGMVYMNIDNIGVIVSLDTYLVRSDNYKNIGNWGQANTDFGTFFVDMSNKLQFNSNYTGTVYITIKYTKTTD